MEVVNDRYHGCVIITHTKEDVTGSLPTKVKIQRRFSQMLRYNTIGEKNITDATDLNFTALDYYVKPNKSYDYMFVYEFSTGEELSSKITISTPFVGILLRDSRGEYISGLNAKCSYKRNRAVKYVQSFYGRTPHAIINGNANYDTGNCSGLFLPLDDKGKPIICNPGQWNAEWNKAFLDFLTNGEVKLLKIYSGEMWMVQIDDTPYEELASVGSISDFRFSWTEITDVPETELVVFT